MEMVQFHPTGLLAGPDTRMTGTVLEEGLRGAGGHLLNGAERRFMADYDPKLERATRDIVSRAIYAEMRAGRTTQHGGVYIKMGHLGPEKVAKQFKGMVERCADCGFDLAGGLVEVVPTAHYFMGGLVCGVDTSTELPGLFVAGEDAERRARRQPPRRQRRRQLHRVRRHRRRDHGGLGGGQRRSSRARRGCDRSGDGARAASVRAQGRRRQRACARRLLDAMWDDVGVLRDAAGLQRGLGKLDAIEGELLATGVPDGDRAFNLTWHDWLNLRSLVEISKVITLAALKRENSRGAHYREDFPGEGDLATSTLRWRASGTARSTSPTSRCSSRSSSPARAC